MELKIGTHPILGLDVYRELDYFIAGIIEPKITIVYREWYVSPTQVRLEPTKEKKHFVVDILEMKNITPSTLINPEVLGEDGVTVIAPAVYSEEIVQIITPQNLAYTNWRTKLITQQMVGAKLGDDIIIAQINQVLQSLAIE